MQFLGGGQGIAVRLVGRGLAGTADGLWVTQEKARLVKGFADIVKASVEADKIEKIAILARGRIRLMCS